MYHYKSRHPNLHNKIDHLDNQNDTEKQIASVISTEYDKLQKKPVQLRAVTFFQRKHTSSL